MNYGTLIDNTLHTAPRAIRIGGAVVCNPRAEDFARLNVEREKKGLPPYLPVVDEPPQTDAAVLVPCRGDGAALEQTVRALERARCEYGGFRRIVILDRGMDEDAKRVAALLCREAYDVTYHNERE